MNLLTELQKHYKDNKISITERYIEDIKIIENPEYTEYVANYNNKSKTGRNYIPYSEKISLQEYLEKFKDDIEIKQDNSIQTYNVVFDGVETDAQIFYSYLYLEDGKPYDLSKSVGQQTVNLVIKKVDDWINSGS